MNVISIVQKIDSEIGRLVYSGYYGEVGETEETGAFPSLKPHQHASQTPYFSVFTFHFSLRKSLYFSFLLPLPSQAGTYGVVAIDYD